MTTSFDPTTSRSHRRLAVIGGLVAAIGLTAGLLAGASSGSSDHAAGDQPATTVDSPAAPQAAAAELADADHASSPQANGADPSTDNGGGTSEGGSSDDGGGSPAVEPVPAELGATPPNFDFGTNTLHLPLTIANTGGQDGDFAVMEADSWLSVSPSVGVVPAGEQVVVDVAVTRIGMAAGSHFSGDLDVHAGGVLLTTIPVEGAVPNLVFPPLSGPEIEDVNFSAVICAAAGPIGPPQFTPVTADLETHGLNTTVSLHWEWVNSSGDKAMPYNGGSHLYGTALGPYPGGTVEFTVTASNVAGDDSSGPYEVHVVPCP